LTSFSSSKSSSMAFMTSEIVSEGAV